MVADAFDKLICSLEGQDTSERSGDQVKVHVIKRLKAARRKEYTLLLANSIDHVTAYQLIQENGSVEYLRLHAEDALKAMMNNNIPFVGCFFRLLSYVDWDLLKKMIEQRAEQYKQGNPERIQSNEEQQTESDTTVEDDQGVNLEHRGRGSDVSGVSGS